MLKWRVSILFPIFFFYICDDFLAEMSLMNEALNGGFDRIGFWGVWCISIR